MGYDMLRNTNSPFVSSVLIHIAEYNRKAIYTYNQILPDIGNDVKILHTVPAGRSVLSSQ